MPSYIDDGPSVAIAWDNGSFDPYEKKLRNMIDGRLIKPCGLETGDWCPRNFPVFKSNGTDILLM